MKKEIAQALQQLLQKTNASSQEALCTALQNQGFKATQSTVSRLLRKLGAVKITAENGDAVYTLTPHITSAKVVEVLKDTVSSVEHNETMIVIRCNSSAASLIAHVLDDYRPIEFLGSLAGHNTVFVAPVSIKHISKDVAALRNFFKV